LRFEGKAVVNKVWVLVAAAAFAAAPAAMTAGKCAGEACAAIAAEACTITNKGDKAVQLTTVADQASLMMTVLAPGETVKQDKELCEKFARGEAHYDARFATLRTMPDAPDFTLKTAAAVAKPAPKPKPAPVAAPAEVAVAVVPEAPAPAAPVAIATPRPKPAAPPAYPPVPRAKPAAPELASVPAPVVAVAPVAPVAPVSAIAPTASIAPAAPPADCGEACATILFKVVDNCLWVVNLHPRTVAFEAEASGQRMALMLEAADGEKADARAIALSKGQVAKNEAALHMRLHDPFQSAGSGIPVFRARLGNGSACVKERSGVTRFSARFVN
jgi:hypothetical protein